MDLLLDFLRDPALIAEWFRGLLMDWGLSEGLTILIMKFAGVVIVASAAMGVVIFVLWLERKIAARIQDRFGPNRAGKFGILQSFADMVKITTKELITPDGVDKFVYNLAPLMALASVLLLWAVIPFAKTLVGADLNVGVLYLIAVGSFGILSILMAGWSSNNKYALLGAFRAVAQLVSYEIPMILAILVAVLLARSMGVHAIVEAQGVWFVAIAPLAAVIFFISNMAEVGRAPFDLLEADSEIVAGFNIEYSGMKWGMFMVSEFLHAFTAGILSATLFFGGWQGPGAEAYPILGIFYLGLKSFLLAYLIMLIRTTFPRVRIDQMLNINWKFLTPLMLVILMVTAIVEQFVGDAPALTRVLTHLGVNLVLGWITLEFLRDFSRRHRKTVQVVGEPKPEARPPAQPAE